mmetsp:Transcript_36010/g.102843  ORF Transcript_36010/g.102843 Transcript_36010/m.102843 type:complete len:331 (+) Transcript_36010:1275-2267(+)
MCTPTSTSPRSGSLSTWMASSRSLAVAGSMVNILFSRRSSRRSTSWAKDSCASSTSWSTSSSCSSWKSTSCSSSSVSMRACFSSASRSPALPRHWPLSLPSGRLEVSFHIIIWMGHSWNLSRRPGTPRTFRVTSLIWIRIQGMRASVGFAFSSVSSSRTWPSWRGLLLRAFGCSVQTTTLPVPLGSAMATTLASRGFCCAALRPSPARACGGRPASSTPSAAMTGPVRRTSSSEPESEATSNPRRFSSGGSSAQSSSSCSSSSWYGMMMTMSPCTARFRAFLPMIRKSLTPAFAPSGLTCARLSFVLLALSTPLSRAPDCSPAWTASSSR